MKQPLCQCLNCHEVLIDTNPQVNAELYDVSRAALNELVTSEDVEGYFRGCPNCMTDGYLTDDPPALQFTLMPFTIEEKLFLTFGIFGRYDLFRMDEYELTYYYEHNVNYFIDNLVV